MGKLIIRICVVSLPISLVMTTRIYILCLIIIKSEVWTITHCLGLGHETMVCAVCLSAFLQTITQPKQNKAQHPLPIYSDVLFSLRVLCVQDCATLESTSSLAFRWFHFSCLGAQLQEHHHRGIFSGNDLRLYSVPTICDHVHLSNIQKVKSVASDAVATHGQAIAWTNVDNDLNCHTVA